MPIRMVVSAPPTISWPGPLTLPRADTDDPGSRRPPGSSARGCQVVEAGAMPNGLPTGSTGVPRMPLITPAAEVYQAGQQLAQAAVGEREPQPGAAGGPGHPVGIGRRQQERGQGKGRKPERRRVCRWCQHERFASVGNSQLFPPVEACASTAAGRPPWRLGGRCELAKGMVTATRGSGAERPRSPSFGFTCGSAEPRGRPALRVTPTATLGQTQFYLGKRGFMAGNRGAAPIGLHPVNGVYPPEAWLSARTRDRPARVAMT